MSNDYRMTQDTLSDFWDIVHENNPAQKLRRFISILTERDIAAYPPYWIYRARAAQNLNDEIEAAKCFDKFDEIWRLNIVFKI